MRIWVLIKVYADDLDKVWNLNLKYCKERARLVGDYDMMLKFDVPDLETFQKELKKIKKYAYLTSTHTERGDEDVRGGD